MEKSDGWKIIPFFNDIIIENQGFHIQFVNIHFSSCILAKNLTNFSQIFTCEIAMQVFAEVCKLTYHWHWSAKYNLSQASNKFPYNYLSIHTFYHSVSLSAFSDCIISKMEYRALNFLLAPLSLIQYSRKYCCMSCSENLLLISLPARYSAPRVFLTCKHFCAAVNEDIVSTNRFLSPFSLRRMRAIEHSKAKKKS